MNNIQMVTATPEHLTELANNMRATDLQEIGCLSSREPRLTLQMSADMSSRVETCLIDGAVAAVWGIAPWESYGVPWMLGTPLINDHPKTLIEESKHQLQLMLSEYDHLRQWVDVRNEASVRWLKRLGFTFHDAIPYGTSGELFYPFEIYRDV